MVVCGGLRWFAVVCGGLWWFVVDCGTLSLGVSKDDNLNLNVEIISQQGKGKYYIGLYEIVNEIIQAMVWDDCQSQCQ